MTTVSLKNIFFIFLHSTMKLIITLIGILALFHAVLSTKCYHCNFPSPDLNDPNCTNYEVVDCYKNHYCAEFVENLNGQKVVSKLCELDYVCERSWELGNTYCCKGALCNTQHLQIEHKYINEPMMMSGSENVKPFFWIFLLSFLLVAVY